LLKTVPKKSTSSFWAKRRILQFYETVPKKPTPSFCSRRRISCFLFSSQKIKDEILRTSSSGWYVKVSLRKFWNYL